MPDGPWRLVSLKGAGALQLHGSDFTKGRVGEGQGGGYSLTREPRIHLLHIIVSIDGFQERLDFRPLRVV
jgi:hypothetical protein